MQTYNQFFTEHLIQKDIIMLICHYLTEMDIINFLSSCKSLTKFKKYFRYDTLVNFADINKLDYYNSFTRIILVRNIITNHEILPSNLTEIVLNGYVGKLNFIENIKNLTHLTIGKKCKIIFDFKQFNVPTTLKYLKWEVMQKCPYFILNGIREIYFGNTIIPAFDYLNLLEKITFGKDWKSNIGYIKFPKNIKSIIFESYFSFASCYSIFSKMDIVHLHLKKNYINNNDYRYNYIFHLVISKGCSKYIFCIGRKNNNQKIFKTIPLPNRLKTLKLEENVIMPDKYPTSLEEIIITRDINLEIINSLPKNVILTKIDN